MPFIRIISIAGQESDAIYPVVDDGKPLALGPTVRFGPMEADDGKAIMPVALSNQIYP